MSELATTIDAKEFVDFDWEKDLPSDDQVLTAKDLWRIYSQLRGMESYFVYVGMPDRDAFYNCRLLLRGVANIIEDLARASDDENVISMYSARPVLTWSLED